MLPITISAQKCDCKSVFNWTKSTFEENDAGFQYIIDKKGEQSYSLHNKIYTQKIISIKNPIECETVIREWLSFFRKSHVEFHYTKNTDAQKAKNPIKIDTPIIPKGIENDQTYALHKKFKTIKTPFVEEIDSSTLYIRIPSFLGSQKQLIDSVILANKPKILNTENLIIDIRNGTGGNDASYEELMPFIYTNPIRMPSVEFLSTELNNQRMYDLATNTGIALEHNLNLSEEDMAKFQANYDTLSKHIGKFVNLSRSKVNITKYDTIYSYPKKIGVLINHNNVSTDEQFILEAKQSTKVKFFGTTTKGGLDVSNLNLTFTPDKDFVLVYALSKSLRIPDFVVDDIGIMPDYYIDDEIPEYKWINYTYEILNNASW